MWSRIVKLSSIVAIPISSVILASPWDRVPGIASSRFDSEKEDIDALILFQV